MEPNKNSIKERFDRCLVGLTHPVGIPTVMDIIDPQYGENFVVSRCTYLIEPNHGVTIINIVTKREFRRLKYASFALNMIMNNHHFIRTSVDSKEGESLLEMCGFIKDEKVPGQWVWRRHQEEKAVEDVETHEQDESKESEALPGVV